ncbi:hypothetical protein CMK19_16455 [Candidatus Poribacteria bacterium]|nr:hypothetical protein [Candidatus Poribacteria bacterium]
MIRIEEKSYTAAEVGEVARQVVEYISQQSDHNPLTYSASDVYWVIRDLLKYANGRMLGEFVLTAKKKGEWQIRYRDQKSGIERAKRKRQNEIEKTEEYLKQQKQIRKTRADLSESLLTLDKLFPSESD